jgi:hypothetical protein
MLARLFQYWEARLSLRDRNRTLRPFEWGLDFVRNGVPIGDPREYLIDYACKAVAESDAYHAYAPVRDYRLDGDHLTFTSPIETLAPRNNVVHGRYFPTASRGRAVLVLPQWNSDGQGHVRLARMMNHFGLSALRMSLPYHDLRMPEDLVRADYMLSPNVGRTLQSMRQAVVDCRAAVDWLEGQGYDKVAILGTSLGSCVALITLAHEPRLRLSVQNHVSPYFADVVWSGISTRHVRAGLEGKISLEDLRRIWMPISPKAFLPRLSGTGQRSLLIHARYDWTFLPALSRQLLSDYCELGLPHDTFELRCGHYTSGEFPFNLVLGYTMCRYLQRML